MKAIFIDSKACVVTEVYYDGTLTHLYKLIGNGCHTVEMAPMAIPKHALYVDENGLATPGLFAFHIEGARQMYVGNGAIVGFNYHRGNERDVTATVEQVRALIRFPKYVTK